MPIYNYRCSKCENLAEIFHRSSKSPVPPCPACGAEALYRVMSTFASTTKSSTGPCGQPTQACGQETGMCGAGG